MSYIHGEPGRPVPEYIATKHELLILARHWATELVELLSWWEESGQVGSDELRQHEYFYQRLDAIAGLLGNDAVKEVVDGAIKKNQEAGGDR